jgi:hypothetical protein
MKQPVKVPEESDRHLREELESNAREDYCAVEAITIPSMKKI